MHKVLHKVLGVVHQYRLLSPFSNWLPDSLLFLCANLTHIFVGSNLLKHEIQEVLHTIVIQFICCKVDLQIPDMIMISSKMDASQLDAIFILVPYIVT